MVQTLCKLLSTISEHTPAYDPNTFQPRYTPFGLPRRYSGKESACQSRQTQETCVPSLGQVGKIPWRSKWQLTPVFLLGKSHGERSLAGYIPWGHKESDTTERLSSHAYIYKSVCVSIKTHAQGCLYQVYLLHPRIKTLPNTHQPRMDT